MKLERLRTGSRKWRQHRHEKKGDKEYGRVFIQGDS